MEFIVVPLAMSLWRVDGDTPLRLAATGTPLEQHLERMIEADPSILGERLLILGRQVGTPYGKALNMLAVDSEGSLKVIELKRNRTDREVVAQILDYGSWVVTLTHDQVLELYRQYKPESVFEGAFITVFGGDVPTELNSSINCLSLRPMWMQQRSASSNMRVRLEFQLTQYYSITTPTAIVPTWVGHGCWTRRRRKPFQGRGQARRGVKNLGTVRIGTPHSAKN